MGRFQEGHQKLLTNNRTVFCAFWSHFLFMTPQILNLLGTLTQKHQHLFFVLDMKSSGYIHTQFLNLYQIKSHKIEYTCEKLESFIF